MKKSDVERTVTDIVEPIIEGMGLEFVGAELVCQGKNTPELMLYIDKPGGVFIEDCEAVSRAVDELIEEADPIDDAYVLCVSSPGIDRPLKTDRDFERSIGKSVDVKLYKPFNGQKLFTGMLTSYDKNTFAIQIDEETEMIFTMEETALVRLHVDF